MKNDDGIRIEFQEGTLPYLLDVLDDVYPLRWRELRIKTINSHPLGVSVLVCDDGHVHLTLGAYSPLHMQLMCGLLAYTLALILDTRAKVPRRPGINVIERCISEVGNTLTCVDAETAQAYVQHLDQLRVWIATYVAAHGGAPYRGGEEKPRRRARVRVDEHTPSRRGLDLEEQPSDEDMGASLILHGPEGYVMFGILNTPFTLGEA